MRELWKLLLLMFLTICSKTISTKAYSQTISSSDNGHCLSWRLAAETNNVRAWYTVPIHCLHYVEHYMLGGQYEMDVNMVVNVISTYLDELVMSDNGTDAWILDVDDTCVSNLLYYRGKHFGCDPYDPLGFKTWAMKGRCSAIPAVLGLFRRLVDSGFKVFLLTGRDEETLGQPTIRNLHNQGFFGYERIILRPQAYRGQSAITFKSEMRKQLVEEGYTIWGNVGDQWSDLNGDFSGDRTFKLPNPMYFEFNIEKLQLVEADKRKIQQEYERKSKQVEGRKKIEYSMQLNASRIQVLQAQDDVVNAMKEAASKELLQIPDNSGAYKKLLKDLIVQSLLRLKEPAVLLRCREVDRKLVESVLEETKQEYANKAKVHQPKVTIDSVYLPPPPSKDPHAIFCSGGVVVASQDGKIVCENSLDARLDVIFKKKLPEIREQVSFCKDERMIVQMPS